MMSTKDVSQRQYPGSNKTFCRTCARLAVVLLSLYLISLGRISFIQRTLTGRSIKSTAASVHYATPHQVMQRYMDMHSVEQLQQECPRIGQGDVSLARDCPDLYRRRFAVGFYSCPYQAGNRLHHFMNALAWAIATNRTLLWKYYDYNTCRQVGKAYNHRICSQTGTREKCENVLHLAPWIPSFDDWYPVLHLGRGEVASYYSTHFSTNEMSGNHSHHDKDITHSSIDLNDNPLLDFGQLLGQDFRSLHTRKTRDYLLHSSEARSTAQALLGDGDKHYSGDYLYGMLFHTAFSFSESLLSAVNSSFHNETTIAIHSRHSGTKDDGSQVTREVNCLRQMLRNVSRPCRVFVMSDRPKAVQGMSDAVAELNCSVTTFNHEEQNKTTSFSVEHGPFAGAGFFLDLVLASQARHGLVGTRRSSTMLLAELIAYANSGEYVFCNYEKDCLCRTPSMSDTV